MNSDPLNLSPVSSHLAAESRPSFVACVAVAAHDLPSSRTDVLRWFGQRLLRLVEVVKEWYVRDQRRAQLAHLAPWIQRDLGLTDAEIWRELRKYPWEP